MFTRCKSIDGNQTVLPGFVNKQDKQEKLDKKRTTSKNPSTPDQRHIITVQQVHPLPRKEIGQ